MKSKALLWWGLICGAIALIALVLGLMFFWPANGWNGRGYGNGYGGMMGGSGYGGMMGGSGYDGMMGGSGGMMGMMSGGTNAGPSDVSTAPLSLDQAADAARRYVENWGNSDLKVKEILEFTNGFYARVDEQSTGAGAFELIVDRNTGVTYPESGPNMMWNTKYGIWGSWSPEGGSAGMMGGYGGMMGAGMMGPGYGPAGYSRGDRTATTDMPVTETKAKERAQQFLDRQLPGTQAAEPDTFYGYYTVEVEKDGRVLGMLSVHGYYGQVWFHSWHGSFLNEKQL